MFSLTITISIIIRYDYEQNSQYTFILVNIPTQVKYL